jgi:hypothetical protein
MSSGETAILEFSNEINFELLFKIQNKIWNLKKDHNRFCLSLMFKLLSDSTKFYK